jgi:hypothetical protein
LMASPTATTVANAACSSFVRFAMLPPTMMVRGLP